MAKDWKSNLDHRKSILRRVFMSPDGQEALTLLREMFCDDSLIGRDTHDTYYNLGQRSVVKYIEGAMDRVES